MINWNDYKNFSEDEFKCSETGECAMRADFLDKLQQMRTLVGQPFTITSGYRSEKHSVEVKKDKPGIHTMGRAADIACDGRFAFQIIKAATLVGMTGIGVSQRGSARFVHVDDYEGGPRPNVWSY